MSSSNDHIFGFVGIFSLFLAAPVVAMMIATMVQSVATEAAPQASTLTPVSWTPCEAPRPDVECWHAFAVSQRVVVCLPLSSIEEKP